MPTEKVSPPLLDQEFLRRSLHPVDIEERRRFEELLIRYGLQAVPDVETIVNNYITQHIVEYHAEPSPDEDVDCYWIKEGANLYYMQGHVGVQAHAYDNNFEVCGNVLVQSATETPYIELQNCSDTERDPQIKYSVGATPIVKFVVGVDDSDSDKYKISNTSALGVLSETTGSYGDKILYFHLNHCAWFGKAVDDFANPPVAGDILYDTAFGSGDTQRQSIGQDTYDDRYLYYSDNKAVKKVDYLSHTWIAKCVVDANIWGICIRSGYLYVMSYGAVSGNLHLYKIDADAMTISATYNIVQGSLESQLASPRGISTDGTNIFICEYGSGPFPCVKKFTMSGVFVSKSAEQDAPISCDCDANYVYVSNVNGNVVIFNKSDWSLVDTIVPRTVGGYVGSPTSIAINGTYFYVWNYRASSNTSVDKYDIATRTFQEAYTPTYAGNNATLSYGMYIVKYETAGTRTPGDLFVIHQDGTYIDMWPKVRLMDDLRLVEDGDIAAGDYVGLKAPTTVTASYNITLPAAVPTGTSHFSISSGGIVSWGQDVNTTASPTFVMLTLNQGAADTSILNLKSSDVAHGMTSDAETDTWCSINKFSATLGGANIDGWTESVVGMAVKGHYTTGDTTKSTSSAGGLELSAFKKSGASGYGNSAANENIVHMRCYLSGSASTRWILDSDGDTYQVGNLTGTYFVSNVATGTAPVQPTSTTLCTNLNSDMWDGYHEFMSDTLEPTGFENRTDSTLSWDDGTRTFTITGTNFSVWYRGVKYLCSTDTSQIADTTGFYWFYYEVVGAALNLTNSTVFPGFDVPLVGTVYWNTIAGMDKGLVADERHGIIMDSATHQWAHETIGIRYESGLTGTFADSTFSIAEGYIHDEDIDFQITPAKTACDVMYLDGSADWKWLANQTVYYYTSGGNLYYNNGTTLTAADANKYVAVWVFATTSPVRPIAVMIGQRQDTTLADARLNNNYATLSFGTLPFREMKILYRVILQNDVTPYVETLDLRSVSNISSGTYVATNHNTLTGLTTGDDHTQYAYCKVHATATPGVDDDITNYRVGTIWIEEDANKAYVLVDNADGAAVWTEIGAGGASAFLDLTDVDEADYTGHAGEFVVVNGDEDALIFSASSVAAHALTSVSHTDVNAGAPDDEDILQWDAGTSMWIAAPLPAAAPHGILSATHNDSAVNAPTRGSIIIANSAPEWTELTIGTSGYVLSSDGTDISWTLVPTHASRHQSGGADAIKLDDLAAPDDNTDLNVSTSLHGLVPKAPNDTTKFLRGDAAWSIINNKTFNRISGRYYSAAWAGSAIGTQAWTADYVYVWPFYVSETQTFDRIAVAITSGNGAGRKAMIGIYDNVTTVGVAYPNVLLDSYECDFSTTGIKEDTAGFSVTLTPGIYWLAFYQSFACTIRNISLAGCPAINIGHTDAATAAYNYMYLSRAYDSTLPSPFTAGATPNVVSTGLPFVCMRMA